LVFAAANMVVIFRLSEWETIPFHFIWVSLTLLYGFRVWSVTTTAAVLAVVMVVTGVALTGPRPTAMSRAAAARSGPPLP
jgi:hypothetical protein